MLEKLLLGSAILALWAVAVGVLALSIYLLRTDLPPAPRRGAAERWVAFRWWVRRARPHRLLVVVAATTATAAVVFHPAAILAGVAGFTWLIRTA